MEEDPWHRHPLVTFNPELERLDSGTLCQVCKRPLYRIRESYYRCKDGCHYYLHCECNSLIQDLKLKCHVLHPLHPRHYLTLQFDKTIREFICSFCQKATKSKFFFRCGSSFSCDFYLHIACSNAFSKHKNLLPEYQFQYFHDKNLLPEYQIQYFHHCSLRSYHYLSPYIINSSISHSCIVCLKSLDLSCTENRLIFKCICCSYSYLHVQCSQIRIEIAHSHHPQNRLIPENNSPAGLGSGMAGSDMEKPYHALESLSSCNLDACVIHCIKCSDFNLHIKRAFKSTIIYDGHHHPLEHFEEIHLVDVVCSACKTPCKEDSFRCTPCNFNLHSRYMSLPLTVHDDDLHVHPLTLTCSFKEDKWGHYYCDICETKRDPNYSTYSCEECPFDAHIHCALPKDHPIILKGYFPQKLEDSSHTEDGSNTTSKENDTRNGYGSQHTIILHDLRTEVRRLKKVVQELMKEKQGEQLIKKLKEIDEKQCNIEAMLCKIKHPE